MKYIKCSCSSEILAVDYDKELEMLDVCIYNHYATPTKRTLWDKLRYIWQVIKTGQPYSDQMIIDVNSAEFAELLEYLNSIQRGKNEQ